MEEGKERKSKKEGENKMLEEKVLIKKREFICQEI